MSELIVPVPDYWATRAHGDPAADYAQSLNDPDTYWKDKLGRLDWLKVPTKIDESSFDEASTQ